MKNYNESDLDAFLKNLLQEEYAISLIEYNKKYGKDNEYIIHCYSMLEHQKKGWLGSNGAFISIAVGMKPVVENFLQQGGFVNEKIEREFEQSAKRANYDLIVNQNKEIKVSRWISITAISLSIVAIIISIIAMN